MLRPLRLVRRRTRITSTVASQEQELKVIGVAKKILQETSSGAVSQSYDSLQLHSRTDLIKSEVLTAVKGLARRSHSAALAQLASKMSVVMQYGGASQNDVFAKIQGLVNDMIAKLEKEAEEDAAEKAYCEEEMAKTEAKKQELDDEIAKLTSKIDKAAAKSTRLKGQVKEAQATLAALAKRTAEMNKLRQDQNADYKAAMYIKKYPRHIYPVCVTFMSHIITVVLQYHVCSSIG